MAKNGNNFKLSIVEMFILMILQVEDMYGYQLSNSIEAYTNGRLFISESTLYPTLYKLLKSGYISGAETVIDKNRVRVYYHLEECGKARLADLLKDYRDVTLGFQDIEAAVAVKLEGE